MENWLNKDKSSGEGNATVKFTVASNEEKDRNTEAVIRTDNNSVVRIPVHQPGKRDNFNTIAGDVLMCGSDEFLILK